MTHGVRIAFCENGAGYGGAVISLEAFLAHLPAPFEAYIYTGIGSGPYPLLARFGQWRHLKNRVFLKTRRLKQHGVPFVSAIDNLVNVLPTVLQYYWHFKRDRIDIVYLNNDASCNIAAALAAHIAGLPTVLHARGFNSDTRGNRWVMRVLQHCMPVSTAVRTDVLALGLQAQKCTVIAEGLDLVRFQPRVADPALRASLSIGPADTVVTLVGGLVDWKGQDVLLAAAPHILAKFPHVRFLLVGGAYGKDRAFADNIAVLAASPALNGRVSLLGARDDVAEILALSDIVLHTSTLPEPFGRTFLEGMALGKAVIASNEGGPLDVIDDGVDGLLIAPRDATVLAAAVIRLLEQPAFAAQLGSQAVLKARQFSIERHAANITAILHQVAAVPS